MKNKFIVLIIFVTFVICAIFYIRYDIRKASEKLAELEKEYPQIQYEDEINGIVIKNFIPKGFRDSPHLKQFVLDDSHKYGIYALNKNRQIPHLARVFGVGTSIKKEANSDVVFIKSYDKTDTITYEYILYKYTEE